MKSKASQNLKSDVIPFESSSIAERSEGSDPNMKYNKRPAIYNQVSSKRLGGRIDARKRKTLTTQVQLSRTKLETIKETSNFESRVSMAELDNTKNVEQVSFSLAQNTTKTAKVNNDLVKYEKAITQKVTQWSLIAVLVLYIIMLAYLIVGRFFLESIFQDSKIKASDMSQFYESLSLQRIHFNSAYFTILRSIAFNDGATSVQRFEKNRAKFDVSKRFVNSSDFQTSGNYKMYLNNQLQKSFTNVVSSSMKLSGQLNLDTECRDFIFNRIISSSQPNWRGTFDIKNFELYRSILGPYLYQPLYEVLKSDATFFKRDLNQTMSYSMVMYNYLFSFYHSVNDLFAKSRYNFVSSVENFFFDSIILTLCLVGIAFLALILTWVFSFMDLRSFQRTTTSIFSCSKEDLDHRKTLLTRLSHVLQNHKSDNFFYIGHLRGKDLEAGNDDYPKNVRMVIFGQKKFDWLGTLTSLVLITLFYLLVISIGAANTTQYFMDTNMLLRYTSRLELFTNIPLNQTYHLNLILNQLFFGGSLEKSLGISSNYQALSEIINREENSFIKSVVQVSEGAYINKPTLDDFFNNLLLGDVCLKTFGNDPKTEACWILDKAVASKGYIQTAVGFSHTLIDLNNAITDSSNDQQKKLSFFTSPDFAEFEYMEDNYYIPIYVSVLTSSFSKLRDFLANQLNSSNLVWVYLLIGVSSISPFVFLFSLSNINARFLRLRFIYHVVPVWAVITNYSLRSQMLQTFKLNKNFFQ